MISPSGKVAKLTRPQSTFFAKSQIGPIRNIQETRPIAGIASDICIRCGAKLRSAARFALAFPSAARKVGEAVRGAFAICSSGRVDNLQILLLDDVMTTGATLDARSRALGEAGAKSGLDLTLARDGQLVLSSMQGKQKEAR